MSRVYSALLASHVFGGPGTETVTVPDGHLWVCRFYTAYHDFDTERQPVPGFAFKAGDGTTLYARNLPDTWTGYSFKNEGREVLEPGETLTLKSLAQWEMTVSGYDLTLP